MPRLPITDTDFLKKARDRFKLANDADVDQAKREREDLAFYAGDQWPADIMLNRQGQQANNGMPAVPARPTLVINKVREPVRQVQNEIAESDIGIELTPADDFGDLGITPDDTEITLREGLVRRILRDSKGQDAWNWAGDRATQAGRGYFAVLTRYLPGKTNDQEIYLDRLFNQASVVGDPSRTEPDGSDSSYWFWGVWMLGDRFVAEYGKDADGKANPFIGASSDDFMGASEAYPGWYRQEGKGDDKTWSVRVVNYLYTEYVSKELVTLPDGTAVWADELPEGAEATDRRTVVEKQIKFCKIGGGVVELERTDWPTQDMPIIETIGEELHPYDEQRRIEGMIRNARDSQMGFNYMVSKQVETVGLTPIPPLMVDPDGIDGYEAWYAMANTRALPYLPYRTRNDEGQELREPHRPPVDPNILPIAQSIAMFDASIKSTTAVPDPTLGNVDPTLKSGRAIRETVANAKGSTSNFLTNRVRSIRRAAEVINGLLYPIYGQRPGRLVRVMTGEGQPEMLMIATSEDGQQQQQAMQNQQAAKQAKLTKDAKFNLAVKITKNFDTRRQQENSEIGNLISSDPQFMTWFGDLYLSSSDMPNRKQMAERAKAMLAPPILKVIAEKEAGQEPLPPHVEAMLQQQQQQLEHAEAALQELQKAIDSKQVEAEARLQETQMKSQQQLEADLAKLSFEREKLAVQEREAAFNNLTKLAIAEMQLGIADSHEHAETLRGAQGRAHEAAMADGDRDHQMATAQMGMAHEAALGDVGHDQALEQGEQGQQFAIEQQAMQPDPEAV